MKEEPGTSPTVVPDQSPEGHKRLETRILGERAQAEAVQKSRIPDMYLKIEPAQPKIEVKQNLVTRFFRWLTAAK